jgi:hypothetical protein
VDFKYNISLRCSVDSGTSCLTGPQDIIERMRSVIHIGSDCHGLDTAPNVTFVIRLITKTNVVSFDVLRCMLFVNKFNTYSTTDIRS